MTDFRNNDILSSAEDGHVVEADKTSWIYCNVCKVRTRHVLVASKEYDNTARVEDGQPAEWGEYRFWACAGCDTCAMEDCYTAPWMERDTHDSIFFPRRMSSSRLAKHFMNLPPKLGDLYDEVIKSRNEELHLLCAAGLRSLLEGVCADKGIQGGNLEVKIDRMKSLLPESIVKNLHGFRFMGNRAVHELEAPKEFELSVALDVIEDILNFLYALDYNANLLGKMRAAQAEVRAIPATSTAVASNERSAAIPTETPSEKRGD